MHQTGVGPEVLSRRARQGTASSMQADSPTRPEPMDEYTTEYDKPAEAKLALTMSKPTAARLQTLVFEKLILKK